MSFEHALVTKGFMFGIGLTSVVNGVFDTKHWLHLQLVPHISKHHQYWRLFTHLLACTNSSDLVMMELLLYNASIPVERALGSVKFASFLLISAALDVLLSFVTLIILQVIPPLASTFNIFPSGPLAIAFALLHQYMRLLPPAYHFRVFGVNMSDKIWVYAIAGQLAIAHLPAGLLPIGLGLLTGYVYRSDIMQLKGWRVSPKTVRLAEAYIRPLLLEAKPVRRTNRVLPEPRSRTDARRNAAMLAQDEPITTAPSSTARQNATDNALGSQASRRSSAETGAADSGPANGPGVVRQWMTELASDARPGGTVRASSEGEIQILAGMFPDIDREVVLGVLQRSQNIEAAAETLLTSQTGS